MMSVNKFVSMMAAATLLISMSTSAGVGDNLGFVTIKSKEQETVVKNTIDRAYTRVSNQFLCAVNSDQARLLAKAGIEFELVFRDVDPASTFVIRKKHQVGFGEVDLKQLGPVYELSEGVTVAVSSRLAASSLHRDPQYMVNSLDELNIRILYLPKVVEGFLSGLDEYPSDSLADRVSMDSLYAWVSTLEAFQTRFILADSIDSARDWLVQKFLDWGYTDVTTPSFYWGGDWIYHYPADWHYNVMAVKQGWAEPDKVIVIGGHYDSITFDQPLGPEVFAPGADDNATGTAVVLELARILADIPLRKTVIFIPFTAEESGLVGSRYAAEAFVDEGTDVELMMNWDMVAYDPLDAWELDFAPSSNSGYIDVAVEAALRVSALNPVIDFVFGGVSDDFSFSDQGFSTLGYIETDFNYPGWHTEQDLTSTLNFPYFTDVVRTAAATLGLIADAACATNIEALVDQGDGQSVEVFWSDCDPTYDYWIYYGTETGVYTDTIEVPSGMCSYVVTGLEEGVLYNFAVMGFAPGGIPAPFALEESKESFVVPRTPTHPDAQPDLNKVVLTWTANQEADLSHYHIYRGTDLQTPYQDNVTEAVFEDIGIPGHVEYTYRVTAVDNDGYESLLSDEVCCMPATFDGGILVVDEITASFAVPNQAGQVDFFNSMFGPGDYAMISIDDEDATLPQQVAGQYSSLFWFDDEVVTRKYIGYSEDNLAWYLGYADNAFIAGYRTIEFWDNPYTFTYDVPYDEFGLQSYSATITADFAGAFGQNGWPSVQLNTSTPLGHLPWITFLEPRAGAEVIYTYDSNTDDPASENQPCGLLYDTPNGKRILLGFPVLFLTETSAQDLIGYVRTLFDEQPATYADGDLNRSGGVNISDVVYLVSYLFGGGPAPVNPNLADVNSSCTVNISDVSYLVAYLFGGGPLPQSGCVY
ncbi:MAG: M20/M25/M40 family metallo-hydrolase [candidate division Zixibacteria bacterium]|nr:M20/M25/M40 family metallo-hydrolase [candidate division Zixibacteria bacterium]